MSVMRYREAVRTAMIEEMDRDPNVYLIGEEVGHYQGAYKVSEGMLERFGERARDRHAHHRERLHRRLHRRRDGRASAHRRVHDLQLLGGGLRPDPQQRGQAPPDVGRASSTCPSSCARPTGRRGRWARSTSHAMEHFYAHIPGLKVLAAGHAGRRQGPPEDGHPRRRPGALHGERDALRREGRGAGRSELPRAHGPRQRGARGQGRDDRLVEPPRARGPRSGAGAGARRASTPRSSTCAPSAPSTRRPSCAA